MPIALKDRLELLEESFPVPINGAVPLWVNGDWRQGASQDHIECVDPTLGERLVSVSTAAQEDVEVAIEAARTAQAAWWALDGQDRARILRRIADGIRQHARALGTLDTLDAGRPIRDTATRDTERAARIFEFFAGTTDRIRGAFVPVQPGRGNTIEYEPIGLVGAITPWNYPLTNAAGKIAPALATGNAVILKPAEESPLSALVLAWVAHQAGLPAGLLNVLNGTGSTAGEALVRHPAIGKICFTGSTSVGRAIGAQAGRDLKSVTLELGGKTGFLIFADADLERAADALVFSAFNNAGQTCTAGSRLLIEAGVANKFLALVAERVSRIRIGDPLDAGTQMGPAISARHQAEVLRWMSEATGSGLEQLDLPGQTLPEQGYFLKPTIYTAVDPACATAQNEIFGPVLTVTTFRDDDEALAIANGTPYGLATTVWTENIRRARRIAREADSGIVWINTVHVLHPGSPYGGFKQSGIGVEMGHEAIQQHMRIKSVWIEDGPWVSPWAE